MEDPAPGEILGDDTANGGTCADAECHDDGIQAKSAPKLTGRKDTCGEGDVDGKYERSPQSLEGASGNKYAQGGPCARKGRDAGKKSQSRRPKCVLADHITTPPER